MLSEPKGERGETRLSFAFSKQMQIFIFRNGQAAKKKLVLNENRNAVVETPVLI